MRPAAVAALFLLGAAPASASIQAPTERPLSLEEVVNKIAGYWEVIFEGTVELISLPTPAGNQMWCSRMTFSVERGIAGEPDSVIQALTIALPPGLPPPPTGVLAVRSDQVPLPMAGSRGLFFLHRAGTEAWACNPARLLFSGSAGAWIENAGGVAAYAAGGWNETYPYDSFVTALEAAVHVRSLSLLTSQASLIARVVVGRRVDMAVIDREDFQIIRYPIVVSECYRGDVSQRACAIVFEDRSLTDIQQERHQVDQLQLHEGGEALILGARQDSSSVTVLPGGVLTIDQQGIVNLGLKAAGDTATVILKPLASIEQQLH
jgi:hypothetical protein